MADFDSTFDYTNALAEIATRHATDTASLSEINDKIAVLEAMTGYAEIVADELADLNAQKQRLLTSLASLTAVQTEIGVVQALSSESKATLFYIYSVLQPAKPDFMLRVLFNHVAALADPDVTALIADETNSAAGKIIVANKVYARYPIYALHIVTLVSLYRYMM